MREIFIKDYYGEYDGMTDAQLFGICFNQCGPEHPIAELIRRFIVLRNDWAKKEAEFQKAKLDYIAKKQEYESKYPVIEQDIDAVDLLNNLSDAIKCAMDFDNDWETADFRPITTDGKLAMYDLGVQKDGEKYCIKIDFKNW